MTTKFLKAGKGDSILIHSAGKNMLVDGGDDTTYLFKELDELYKKREKLDFLAITHHDSDHIKGIIDLLKELQKGRFGKPTEFIGEVFFNSPSLIKGNPISKDTKNLSYKQASLMELLLFSLKLKWEKPLLSTSSKILLGDATIFCLSPTNDIANGYAENKGARLSSNARSDWEQTLKYLENRITDDSQDKSIPNQSSLVFMIEEGNQKGLLTGDVTPSRLEEIINDLYEKNNKKLLKFDFFKLPHHGSHRSISKGIISKLDCKNFVISTNGKNNYLPNKKTLLKVSKYRVKKEESCSFLFNYSETMTCLRVSKPELSSYRFILSPNNYENGYII